jgi:hypothetical protein
VSTRFFAHPREITPTEGRGSVMGVGICLFADTVVVLSEE